MKYITLVLSTITILSCSRPLDQDKVLQNRVDSLEMKLADTYKPGFGEFMSTIQVHHNKLWYAGINQNWALADFEVHEIMEAIADIKKYQKERVESELIYMIDPALDSINEAIRQQDPVAFKSKYVTLTNTCNDCHREAKFEFNVVKIPDSPPFSNQDFKPSMGH